MKSLSLFLVLIAFSTNLYSQNNHSQFTDMLDGRFDVSDYLSENAYGFLPVPIIITDPAVDGGLGMLGLFFHETEEEKKKRLAAMKSADKNAVRYLMPPSISAVAAGATGNDSWFVGGGHLGFFKQGRIRYKGGGGYGDINLDYFGSGSVTLSNPVELKTKAQAIIQTLSFKIADSPFFIGVSQRYINAQISINSLGSLDTILPPDFADELKELLTLDVTTSGLGFYFEFDTRDNMLTPTEGYQYTLEQLWYRESIGSDIDYNSLNFEGLNYWPLLTQWTDRWRMGLRLNSEYADSNNLLPPFATPTIKLRGIPAMRYQGQFIGAAETEITWRVDSRWSLLSFMGAGRASNSTSSFSDASTRVTQGVGFRYQIARRYGLDMGLDVAKGPEDTVWYITAGSAWGR